MIVRVRSRAFTLVELLVVISIIAVLAAIFFPVFSRARERARQTVCLSKLRQIGMATAMYRSDNDDVYPHAVNYWDKLHPDFLSDPPIPASTPIITDVLQPDCHSYEVFYPVVMPAVNCRGSWHGTETASASRSATSHSASTPTLCPPPSLPRPRASRAASGPCTMPCLPPT